MLRCIITRKDHKCNEDIKHDRKKMCESYYNLMKFYSIYICIKIAWKQLSIYLKKKKRLSRKYLFIHSLFIESLKH